MSIKTPLNLYVFIDALGWEVLQKHPCFLNKIVKEARPLETIFGYSSACDPSIISGRRPSEHGFWSAFFYAPGRCPYAWLRYFSWLPRLVTDYHKVRHRLSRWIAERYGFTGYFQLYNMPFKRLHYFDYAEKYRIWEPGGMPGSRNLFDVWNERGTRYWIDDRAVSDDQKFDSAEELIRGGQTEVLYLLLGGLDGLMHRLGPKSPDIAPLLDHYATRIQRLVELGEGRDVNWIVFSDHGMHAVQKGYDLQSDIEQLGLRFGRDYAAVYDSTMARFWFLKEGAREKVLSLLAEHPEGELVSEEDLKAWGTYWPDHRYGESIFLMHSGTMIAPCDMGRKAIAGMHGFHPDDPDSKAAVLSGQRLPADLQRIEQLYELMLSLSSRQLTPV